MSSLFHRYGFVKMGESEPGARFQDLDQTKWKNTKWVSCPVIISTE